MCPHLHHHHPTICIASFCCFTQYLLKLFQEYDVKSNKFRGTLANYDDDDEPEPKKLNTATMGYAVQKKVHGPGLPSTVPDMKMNMNNICLFGSCDDMVLRFRCRSETS